MHADFLLAVIRLCQVQQTVYQSGHSLGVLLHVLHGEPVLLVGSFFLQRNVDFGSQGSQRSAELVRNVAHKLLL